MFKLLIKCFIKDRDNVKDAAVRTQYGVLSGGLGIFLNVMLFIGKYITGVISGSIAVMADAFNNLSDAGSSVVTLLGFRLASRKPDEGHPFGHGRMEYVSALVVSMLIILMGFEIGKASIEKIIAPEAAEISTVTILVLAASIAVKFYMYAYNKKYGERIDSSAMKATAADSLSDAVSTSVVLLSMAVMYFFKLNIDGWCGTLVAIFILKAGIDAASDTLDDLLGKAPSPEFIDEIEKIVTAHEEVIGIHDLIIHDYGPGRRMISLHGEVSSDGDILVMHDIIDNIEKELKEKLDCDAVIHMDPIETDNEQISAMKLKVSEAVRDISSNISMHDFRMVTGPTHTNLVFDMVVPFETDMADSEIKRRVSEKIRLADKNVFCVINIDRPYAAYRRKDGE